MHSLLIAVTRTAVACILIAFVAFITVISSSSLQSVRFHGGHIQKAVLNKWLQQTHAFIPASDNAIEYVGRWTPRLHGSRWDASFRRSHFSFSARNTSSIILSFSSTHGRILQTDSESHRSNSRNIDVYPASIHHGSADPSSILLKLNGTAMFIKPTPQGLVQLGKYLEHNLTYHITIENLGGITRYSGATEFEGVWLDRGGELTIPEPDSIRPKSMELYSSISTLSEDLLTTSNRSRDVIDTFMFTDLLEHNCLFRTDIVTLSVPSLLCLTSKCHSRFQNLTRMPTAQDLYFRSGPLGTHGCKRPWTHSSRLPAPTLVLLEVGYWDFYIFLSDKSNHNSQAIDTFMAQFVDDYVKFILTMRRVTLHAQADILSRNDDASFVYNSQPSTIPIFLMPPPLPSSYDRLLGTALFNAIHRVTTSLQRIKGDTKTFLIDTSGWLDSNDFVNSSRGVFNPYRLTESLTGEFESPLIPVPTRHGRIKIANYLVHHLCPYLHPDVGFAQGTQACPFDRHENYMGNLYLPDESTMAKVMQERKIQKVKNMLFDPDPAFAKT